MATYRVTDPVTGRKLKLTGDSPPTEQELNQIFGNLGPSPKKQPSFSQNLAQVASRALSPQEFSPQSMLQRIPEIAAKGASKLGEVVSQDLSRKQVDPYTSAAVGTLISMGPDIALAGANPFQGTKTIPQVAIKAQRRALGFKFPELKTPFARGQAAQAAKIALEQGVTSATGSPSVMFQKALDLAAKSGQKLGAIRQSVGQQSVQPVLKAIDDYKAIRLQGAKGGKWDVIANKIDEAKATVEGIAVPGTGKASLKRIAAAKKEIKDSVNWMADNVSQRDAKALAQAIEKGSEDIIAASGGDIKTYKKIKPIYGAAKKMIQGLNKEIAAQEGNMAVSLPAIVAGASGGPLTAAKIGGFELAKRRGAGIAASELLSAANAPKELVVPTLALTRKIAKKYLKNALKETNGDLEQARILADERAKKDGYDTSVIK